MDKARDDLKDGGVAAETERGEVGDEVVAVGARVEPGAD
jgi:hypothetical protein